MKKIKNAIKKLLAPEILELKRKITDLEHKNRLLHKLFKHQIGLKENAIDNVEYLTNKVSNMQTIINQKNNVIKRCNNTIRGYKGAETKFNRKLDLCLTKSSIPHQKE